MDERELLLSQKSLYVLSDLLSPPSCDVDRMAFGFAVDEMDQEELFSSCRSGAHMFTASPLAGILVLPLQQTRSQASSIPFYLSGTSFARRCLPEPSVAEALPFISSESIAGRDADVREVADQLSHLQSMMERVLWVLQCHLVWPTC